MNTSKHIHSLQSAAMDLEHQLRQQRRFAADCAGDPIPASRALDAAIAHAKRIGQSGFAILMDGDKINIVPLGGAEASVREPTKEEAHAWESSYKQMTGGEFERAKAESHAVERKAAGRFPPISNEGPEHREQPAERKASPVNDAASIKRAKMTADMKRHNQEAFARNANVANLMREKAKQLWPKRSA
jgi:hypothetical protein